MKKVQDHYFKRAKKEGFPARSVYKLEEAQKKCRFLKAGQTVVDFGAYPGSWSKYVSRVVGPKGLVVAVDLKTLPPSGRNVIAFSRDIYELTPRDLKEFAPSYDVVLSDMAPKTTGRKDVDHLQSVALAQRALHLASRLLKPGGVFFCKVFQGSDFESFRDECRNYFESVRVVKPKSSRSESVETFLLCIGFRRPGQPAGS